MKFLVSDARADVARAASVKVDTYRFLDELDQLRASGPIFPNSKSLYGRPERYNFLVDKDRLTLLRGAIAQVPVDGLPPPRDLLLACLRCATRVLNLHNNVFSVGHITWTRSYFQIMFTSGLSIMYTFSILRPDKTTVQMDNAALFTEAAAALVATSELMKAFVSEMPDSARFAMVFEMPVKHYSEHDIRARLGPLSRSGTATPAVFAPHLPERHDGDTPYETMQYTHNIEHQNVYHPLPEQGAAGMAGLHQQQQHHAEDEFLNSFDFDNFPTWSLNPGTNDNILGQVEASLGEYAWGMAPDESVWSQWDAFQGLG